MRLPSPMVERFGHYLLVRDDLLVGDEDEGDGSS